MSNRTSLLRRIASAARLPPFGAVAFWANCILILVYLYLLWPLYRPVFVGTIYTIYLGLLTVPVLVYACAAIAGGKRANEIALGLAVLLFVSAELSLRILSPAQVPKWSGSIFNNGQHPYYMFTGVPGERGMMPPQQGGLTPADNVYALDQMGFRIEGPLAKKKPADELRIFVLGGSTVFNGAPLAKTIPGQIEFELHKSGFTRATVYNFGVISAVSGQELALLTHLLADYEPDIVISYGGGNDVISPYQYDPRPGFPLDFVTVQLGTQAMTGHLDFRTAFASQLFRSRVVAAAFRPRTQEVRLPLASLREAAGYRTPEWEAAIVDEYAMNLRRMCQIGRAYNFKVLAVLQPLIFGKSPLSEAEEKLPVGDADHAAYVRRQYARIGSVFAKLQGPAADMSCRYSNLSSLFADEREALFWDEIHVTNDGNAKIAKAIAAELTGVLQVR